MHNKIAPLQIKPHGHVRRQIRSPYFTLIALFLFVFLIFNLNLNPRPMPVGDTVPTCLLPFSILLDQSITLDRFYDWYKARTSVLYYFTVSKGHVYSSYPIALPLMITPLYLPVVLSIKAADWPVEKIISLAGVMEKIVASLIASITVVVFFCLLRKIVHRSTALWLSLLFAFGTSTWTISSQALWQHGASQLMIICCLFYLRASFEEEKISNDLLGGLFAALSVAIRPTNVSLLLASYGCIFLKKWGIKRIFYYSFFPAVIGMTVVAHNYFIFGNILGYYALEQYNSFKGNLLVGLVGLLISPGRGLFVYSPFLIFTLAGIYRWFRGSRKFTPPLYLVCLSFVVLHILLISKFLIWWGGYVYGPRYMTDILPCLIILLIPGLKDIVRHLVLKVVFVLLILWSILVQGIGVFYFDGGWHEYPVSVYSNTKRLWDWKDNPISRSVRAGPNVGIHMKWLGLSKPLADGDFRVSYDQVKGPSQMRVKATALFEVTLSNRSENTWVTGCPGVNSINLSYHWYNKEGKAIIWDGHRSKLPFLFRPMKPTNIKLFVTAPNNPGEYILTMDLVQEHVSWFSQKGCKPKETLIEVTQ